MDPEVDDVNATGTDAAIEVGLGLGIERSPSKLKLARPAFPTVPAPPTPMIDGVESMATLCVPRRGEEEEEDVEGGTA